MKPRTEELLYFLLWSVEGLVQPSFRRLDESFESWAYRNGLMRRLSALEKKRLVERADPADARICRLTEAGRLHAIGGRDPVQSWARPWDGKWRLVLFDVPLGQEGERSRLRRYLHGRHFGFLQNSVWITPDPLEPETTLLRGSKVDVEALILLEARPCAGESDNEIAAGAWDFARIDRGYERYLRMLAERPGGKVATSQQAARLRKWATSERIAWLSAVGLDPLLPARLLPRGYRGREAWQKRVAALSAANADLSAFLRPAGKR